MVLTPKRPISHPEKEKKGTSEMHMISRAMPHNNRLPPSSSTLWGCEQGEAGEAGMSRREQTSSCGKQSGDCAESLYPA